jgi:hypothetical protein
VGGEVLVDEELALQCLGRAQPAQDIGQASMQSGGEFVDDGNRLWVDDLVEGAL